MNASHLQNQAKVTSTRDMLAIEGKISLANGATGDGEVNSGNLQGHLVTTDAPSVDIPDHKAKGHDFIFFWAETNQGFTSPLIDLVRT